MPTTNMIALSHSTGSWVPQISGGDAPPDSIAYAFQFGEYTQIGNIIFYDFRLVVSSLTLGSGAGQLQIIGLPFSSLGTTASDTPGICSYSELTIDSGVQQVVCRVAHGQSYINLVECPTTATSPVAMAINNVTSSSDISGAGFYFIS
jgi:hypothetical protein